MHTIRHIFVAAFMLAIISSGAVFASETEPKHRMTFEEYKAYRNSPDFDPSSFGRKVAQKQDEYRAQEQVEEEIAQSEQLYRNEEYGFRIKFPDGWEVQDGDGEHVVKKATKDGSTVFVLVNGDILDSILTEEEKSSLSDDDIQGLELNNFSDADAKEFLDSLVAGQLELFPGSTILDKDIRYIDNRKAAYFKMNQVHKVQDTQVEGISENYFTIYRGKLYQIGSFYPTIPIDESDKESIINASLTTFVFEDWSFGESVDKSDTNESLPAAISNGDWGLVTIAIGLSILFTWGFGLLMPVLIRFVFLKRPVQKWMALIIVILNFIIQGLISAIIHDLSGAERSHSHGALGLVALVAYWILTKESARYMRCDSCGKVIKKETEFCKKCGNKNI